MQEQIGTVHKLQGVPILLVVRTFICQFQNAIINNAL